MVEDFVTYLKANGYSPHTLRAYEATLSSLVNHIAPDSIDRADARAIRSFLSHEYAGSTQATRAHAISAIKSFARFLAKHNRAPVFCTAAAGLQAPKRAEPIPKAVSRPDITSLLSAATRPREGVSAWKLARDRALCLVLYGAGLRAAEALSLPFSLDTNSATVIVMGKGNKERMVPLLPVVRQSIDTYRRLYIESHLGQPNPVLLFDNMTTRDLRRIIQALREELGLPDHVTPHALRHSFATHLHENGVGIRELADLLGHSKISTTAIYVQVNEKSLLTALRACYPEQYSDDTGEKRNVG